MTYQHIQPAISPLSLDQFDRAATAYRAWLVFDDPKC